MFVKTSVSHEHGCVTGPLGPSRLPLPAIGVAIENSELGWKLCRLSEDVMILVDCLAESNPKSRWLRLLKHMHGMLLRRLGKKRVVYLVKQGLESGKSEPKWHSNINLVTGVSMAWLDEAFRPGRTEQTCVVAGRA